MPKTLIIYEKVNACVISPNYNVKAQFNDTAKIKMQADSIVAANKMEIEASFIL